MCDVCGCGVQGNVRVVKVEKKLTEENQRIADKNREYFKKNGIVAINLISAPGSGKTTLLEKTIEALSKDYTVAVLEGDIETTIDAERVRTKGAYAVQLTTGGACHLDALLVHRGIHALDMELKDKRPDFLFIENVGNLVCPASFDLGEILRVVLVSVPEGDDKPLKYPKAFKTSQAFVITKIDLLPYFDFSVEKARQNALAMNPALKVFALSSKTGKGVKEWIEFLKTLVRR
ncbi:hydrogenase nickel incorporation protein HypB [Thermosulfidibacter takaii ABI70S6]|uniref:Hydrogenase nickel incorporation protein HypB n=1 Tax=Thermosulfidibacter takaii (strain DSM 17441 / JCM 13301 / NBRC 103674 / ABI70S6) TaxID=1298851 RepID=A0A0S3QUF2_THET7|nr:hydrogenase nickel incorporation protein HypB [Thermosulfidibacter takaii]BAT71943.1 hydrogenase nickel incorporation protein HypB [Thermosulfidibacter takaii ABI70S6]